MRRLVAVLGTAALTSTLLVGAQGPASARPEPRRDFDVQAHRGGLGLRVESTLTGFAKALRLGVTTLELDLQITRDGKAVVTHDRRISGAKCRDTAPYTPGDPDYPYVGKYVNTLTLAQVQQLDCGSQRLAAFPEQELDPGARMPQLRDVLDLVRRYRAHDVQLNIETKVEAGAPSETAPREQFVQVAAREIRRSGLARQVTIQSFDWGSLRRMRQVYPQLRLVALDNRDFLQVGQPGRSPWLGGLDIDDFGDDPVRAARSIGAWAISPVHGTPQDGSVGQPGYTPYATQRLITRAHRAGLKVIPWTVDDPATMRTLIRAGADGLITDRPDVLRQVVAAEGLRLPRAYRAPATEPLPQAHAHNDYEHARPLQDALERGFTSVEADVWLQDGELRVAHDADRTRPGRTLEQLYLEPLARRVRENHGSVFERRGRVQLLIDLKSDGPSTYEAVERALARYPGLTTTVRGRHVTRGPVEAVISGNRPLDLMRSRPVRRSGYDGRLGDLGSGLPTTLMPLVSDNWTNHFTWTGEGTFPAAERTKLRRIVAQAHSQGYRLRFWATPDARGAARDRLWTELRRAGVDHLNTDDLHGLEDFLRPRPR